MYIPKPFLVDDQETLYNFIESNSFGILFSTHQGRPFATHLPFMIDKEKGILYTHFARANPQWKDMMGQEVMAVFQGPHSYISPTWYETSVSVPTWNYVAVHVYGEVDIIEDEEVLLADLNDMILKYEGSNSSYRIDASNKDFIHGLMNGIVGFKFFIRKVEGKWKLSQNHSVERQKRVISNLEQINSDHTREIAKLMKDGQ